MSDEAADLQPRRAPEVAQQCPFCHAEASGQTCAMCGRDVTASRRVCARCGAMAPAADSGCWKCGAAFTSDLRWKVPVIIALFVAAFLLAIVLAIAGQ